MPFVQGKKEAAEASAQYLRALQEERDAERARVRAEEGEATYQRWLQTDFPAELATELVALRAALSAPARVGYKAIVDAKLKKGCRKRPLVIPHLWHTEKAFSTNVGIVKVTLGAKETPIHMRCGIRFLNVLQKLHPTHVSGDWDASVALFSLLRAVVPSVDAFFRDEHSLRNIIAFTEGHLEKAFIYAVFALGRWLGNSAPHFLFDQWPPTAPSHLKAKLHASASSAAS